MTLTQDEFYAKMYTYAEWVCLSLGVPKSNIPVILAQWDTESGRESDTWCGGNNYAGISPGGKLARYTSVSDFTVNYTDTLGAQTLTWAYGDVLQAMRDGRPPAVVALALARSPWAESRYTQAYYDQPYPAQPLPPDQVTGDIILGRLGAYVSLWNAQQVPSVPPATPGAPMLPAAWAAEAWAWAKLNGVNDGLDPLGVVTEQQAMVFIYRFWKLFQGGGK